MSLEAWGDGGDTGPDGYVTDADAEQMVKDAVAERDAEIARLRGALGVIENLTHPDNPADDQSVRSSALHAARKGLAVIPPPNLEAAMTEAETALAEYLLSDEYRRLLWRAIASRLSTTSNHADQHMKALDLLKTAFPADAH